MKRFPEDNKPVNPLIVESFKWLPKDELRIVEGNGNRLKIRGVALRGNTVSRNQRKYISNEVKKAARTLRGVPLTVNHDSKRIVGHVDFADEEDDVIEYVAEVNDKTGTGRQMLEKLRDRNKLSTTEYKKKWTVGPVEGVSVEADYLFTGCVKCGERFSSPDDYMNHMTNVEHIYNITPQPEGIYFKALSLVEPPEMPGILGTTVELMEMAGDESRLLETVAKRSIEIEMSKTITEKQEQPKKTGETEPSKKPESVLREVKLSKMTIEESLPKFSLGEPFSGYTNFADCVSKNQDKENPEAYCGNIKHQVEGEVWTHKKIREIVDVLNRLVETVNVPVIFPEYKDDLGWKELPASIAATEAKLTEALKKLEETMPKDDLTWKEMFVALPKDDLSWKEAFANLPKDDLGWKTLKMPDPYDDKALKETIAAIKPYDDKALLSKLEALEKRTNDEFAVYKKDLLEFWKPKLEAAEKEAADLAKKMAEKEAKQVKETTDVTTRLDNLEDKMQPQFKGKEKENKKGDW